MTYTQPQPDTGFNIVPGEDIGILAKKMAAAGQKQVAEDIARLKAMGKPIHYMLGEKLVQEEANGQKFEIEVQSDGSKKIISEILEQCLL
jgi:hypothetical protein